METVWEPLLLGMQSGALGLAAGIWCVATANMVWISTWRPHGSASGRRIKYDAVTTQLVAMFLTDTLAAALLVRWW